MSGFDNARSLLAAIDAGQTWISSFRRFRRPPPPSPGSGSITATPAATRSRTITPPGPLVAATLEPDKGIIMPRMSGSARQFLHRLTVMSARATSSTQPLYLLDYLLYYPLWIWMRAGEDQAVT